ncbi:MAG: ATP-dependent helicase, partial [Deltaproteobacteria bacterium]|nr:ATP-dependent helicase [Candidatus Tharpella aukensis]
AVNRLSSMPTLYNDDFSYLKEAIEHLRQAETLQADFDDDLQQISLTATKDLKHRLKFTLPSEVWPDDEIFVLSADPDVIQKEIKRSRKDENAWPDIHYLWQHNPILAWINDKVVAEFGRHEAPVLTLSGALAQGETVFILSGLIPNRKGHPLVHRWFGVTFRQDNFQNIEKFKHLLNRTGLGKTRFPSKETQIDLDFLRSLLPEAVRQAKTYMSEQRQTFEKEINIKLEEQLTALERLRGKQYKQLDLFYMEKKQLNKKEQEKREIERKFDEFIDWVEDTMTTEDKPFIQVIAVLMGAGGRVQEDEI